MQPQNSDPKKAALALKDHKRLGAQIRKQKIAPKEVGNLLKEAEKVSPEAVYNFSRGLAATQETKEQFIDEASELLKGGMKMASPNRKMMLKGIMDETGRPGKLFVIQNISGLKKTDARSVMRDFVDAGGGAPDVAEWLQYAGQVLRKHNIKPSDSAGAVVDAVGDAADWLIDTIEDGVDAILEGIDAILDAITDAGAALVDLFEEVASWTVEQMGNLLAALIEAGRQLGEFIQATFDWTYRAVSSLVQAAFDVGLAIADLLENVVSETYWVLRRFVNGIIENLGPIGDIMDFVLTQVENATSTLWRSTLLAIRFAEGALTDVLDWMREQTNMVFEAVIRAWESIGEALETLYEWAVTAGEAVWWAIGEATSTIGNSIYYVYNFMVTSVPEYFFAVTRGMLAAGEAIAGVVSWAVGQTIEICGDILRAALETGFTIGQMLVEIVRDPGNALNTFMQAMRDIGQTLDDLMQAVLIETAEEFLEEAVDALLEIGEAIVDILEASLRLKAAALQGILIHLVNKLGTFRGLTDEERADAEFVFGNSLDYDIIYLSNEDPLNWVIFGIQDFCTKNPDSRAFVTGNLINFDPSDDNFDRPTLIHELVHVWQYREIGAMYMAEALWAGNTEGYNYGYNETGTTLNSLNGSRTTYSGVLDPGITPNAVNIYIREIDDRDTEERIATDDGSGAIVGDDVLSGSIAYDTGDFDFTLASPPASNQELVIRMQVMVEDRYDGRSHLHNEGQVAGLQAEAALNGEGGNFDAFNLEQQGQIIMHWFVRTRLNVFGTNGNPISYDATPWTPYQQFVANS